MQPFSAKSIGLKIFLRHFSAMLPVRKRQHQRFFSQESGLHFLTPALWCNIIVAVQSTTYIFHLWHIPFFFFFAFITAAHRHALWVNCHLCFAYGAVKRKQWWKQTTITVAWILYWSKALCTEARKRMFHPRSSFDWNCGSKWVLDSWGMV